ncbi:MAG: DUF4231 domain-containing protein, partial [Coleofasciculus sp.]
MTTLDNTNPSDLSQAGENGSPLSRLPIPWIKIGQYLFLAALICTSIISFVVQDKAIIVIWMAVLVSIFVFLVLVDKLDIGVAWFNPHFSHKERSQTLKALVDSDLTSVSS